MTTASVSYTNPPNEAAFTTQVVQLARTLGWLCHHSRPSLRQSGRYSTAIQGDIGLPDLVLAKDGRVILIELKMTRTRTTEAQDAWIAASGGHVFRPADWDAICALLGDGRIIG